MTQMNPKKPSKQNDQTIHKTICAQRKSTSICLSIYSSTPTQNCIVPIISNITAKMNRSQKKNDDDHSTKPAAGGTDATTEENNEEDSRNQGKNEGDDTNRKGLASYAYRDFSKAPNDRGYLDAIQSRVRPPSKKLPTKLNAMLIDPGE
mmetsp:Transcript_20667/g.42457  ORF Transcript_20667/g.42457 Transcript_20667/m.42457 type:complete len:149 (-) Transcript_20667:134-580(-)